MLKTGILNPGINSLLARVRHTNLLVIADRGLPFLTGPEYVDISLVDDIPTVFDVYQAIRANFQIGPVWMAEEFLQNNTESQIARMRNLLSAERLAFEPHTALKLRAAQAIGVIRTADTIAYSNIVLESA